MKIAYQKSFIRQFKKLPKELREEVFIKIDLFEKNHKNPILKTHKLHGQMKKFWSFSINYSHRIIFEIEKNEALFLEIGKHDTYK